MSDAAWPRIAADPGLLAVYGALVAVLDRLGPYELEHRKSAVAVIRPDGAGVLSLHPDGDGLAVTLLLGRRLGSPRMTTAQQVSPGLWHHRLRLATVDDVDDDLREWLTAAYRR